jgi:restriction system protein
MRGLGGFSRSLNAIARENRRMQSATLAAQRAQLRNQQVAARAAAKAAQTDYLASRSTEADEMTETLEAHVDELTSILRVATTKTFAVDFEKLKAKPKRLPFDADGLDQPGLAPLESDFQPASLNFLQRLVPALVQKYDQAVIDGAQKYQEAVAQHQSRESERMAKLQGLKATHAERLESERRRVAEFNATIDEKAASYRACDVQAVIDYFTTVLENDVILEEHAPNVRVGFVPESKQLVVEYQLPTIEVIPTETGYKYVKKEDDIQATPRRLPEVRRLYRDLLAQLACRALYAVADGDTAGVVDVVVLNGFVDTIDPGTGKRITPTIISVRALASELREIDFSKVDATACLMGLKALVSRSAHELDPVRPIVNFNMVDPRFIDKSDVLSGLDSRPNIAELTPSEFEALMTNLFEKMGLETRLTQASRDGGVDCVAWDMRPVVGGKVVIQAKRYKNTVGVSAVRDLFGTMINEGAAKGILVTTSGFGASTYDFSKNKPIELVSGSNLLSMLSEYAGIEAKIEFPDDWQDTDNIVGPIRPTTTA